MDGGGYIENMDPTLAELGDEFTLGDIDGESLITGAKCRLRAEMAFACPGHSGDSLNARRSSPSFVCVGHCGVPGDAVPACEATQ